MKNTWQFLQHIIARVIIKVTHAVRYEKFGITYYLGGTGKGKWAVSLGKYIIVAAGNSGAVFGDNGRELLAHENGHSRQSQLLGPLYLLVVGVYSACLCNLWDRAFHQSWLPYDRVYWYYKTKWTERWADKEGGVDRDAWIRRYFTHTPECKYPAL